MGTEIFASQPDPEHPGWLTWELGDRSRYNHQILGKLLIRPGDTVLIKGSNSVGLSHLVTALTNGMLRCLARAGSLT